MSMIDIKKPQDVSTATTVTLGLIGGGGTARGSGNRQRRWRVGRPLLGKENHSGYHCWPVCTLRGRIRRLPPVGEEDWRLASRP